MREALFAILDMERASLLASIQSIRASGCTTRWRDKANKAGETDPITKEIGREDVNMERAAFSSKMAATTRATSIAIRYTDMANIIGLIPEPMSGPGNTIG